FRSGVPLDSAFARTDAGVFPMSQAPLPKTIADRYEVVEPLGRGSFGQTLLARDLLDEGRKVAIKRLHPENPAEWKGSELFERECPTLRSLRHQGIRAVHEVLRGTDEAGGAAYLVMEYVEGTSLARWIEEGRHIDPLEAVQLLLGMLDILDYLH